MRSREKEREKVSSWRKGARVFFWPDVFWDIQNQANSGFDILKWFGLGSARDERGDRLRNLVERREGGVVSEANKLGIESGIMLVGIVGLGILFVGIIV